LPQIKAHVGPICVFGHTDGLGSTQHNLELSAGRAWAIVEFFGLRGRRGLVVKGFGEKGTINNEPCEGCRRVDIILLPAVGRC
jgi:outer membrane protein OmpA-like peptidoglycan-associated protein